MARLVHIALVLTLTLTLLTSSVECMRFRPRTPTAPHPSLSSHFKLPQNTSEPHLVNIQQITNGGTNAEAYWSFDNTKLSFQAIRDPLGSTHPCDQIYTMNADGSNVQLISTGNGRDTCSFYYPDGIHILYSSTQASDGKWCPPTPDMYSGYYWPVYDTMEIYRLDTSTNTTVQITDNDAYDAETTISPKGDLAVFTSDRSGDLEIYIMQLNDTTQVRRMTYTPGYDGGAVFSYSGNMIAWRAGRPQGENLTDYLNLLSAGLVEPSNMELYVMMDINDPLSVVQLTNNGAVNFSPYFLPDDSGLIFASNIANPMEFHLYSIKLDGTGMTQLTQYGTFNSFPMFSFDGKYLAWESDRSAKTPTQMDVFIAQWSP
jgi:TolB protein